MIHSAEAQLESRRHPFAILARIGCMALAYFLAVKVGLEFRTEPGKFAIVWPPNGLLLGVLLVCAPRDRPLLVLTAALTSSITNVLNGDSLRVSLGFAIVNMGEPCLVAWLLGRFGFVAPYLGTARNVFLLYASALACCAISAVFGALVVVHGLGAPDYSAVWLSFWLADAMALMLVAPMIVTWAGFDLKALRQISIPRTVEAAGLFAVLTVFSIICFSGKSAPEVFPTSFVFPVFPILLWAAARLGLRATAAAILVISMIAIWNTGRGLGPFDIQDVPITHRLIAVQIFLGMLSLSAMALAAAVTEQKSIHETLLDQEARMRLLVSASNVGLWDWNLQTNGVFFSSEWKAQLGYADHELSAHYEEWESRLHPEDRERTLKTVMDFREGRRPDYDIEFRLRHKDGSWRWILVRGALRLDAAGTPVRMMGCHIDISDRKRMENLIARNADEISDFIENAIICMHWVGPDGIILWANQTELNFLGYAREEYIGRHIAEFHVDQQEIQNILTCLIGGTSLQDHAAKLRCKDGSIKDVLIDTNGFWKDGHFIHSRCFTRDNTERKKAEEALRFREQVANYNADVLKALITKGSLQSKLQLCTQATVQHLEAAFARIWVLNEKEQILELQSSAGLYTHIDGGHARVPVGKFKIGLIAQERAPHLTNNVLGDSRVPEQDWARREGLISFAGYPLIVNNRLVGVMAMFSRKVLPEIVLHAMASVADQVALGIERANTDVELLESEKRVRQARQEAATKDATNQAINLFIASISHEIRTPMNGIIGMSDLLFNSELDADQRLYAGAIHKSGEILLVLINNVLDYSKIAAGKFTIENVAYRPATLAQDVLEIMSRQANEKGLVFSIDTDSSIPERLLGDPERVRQVLINLTANAIKFTSKGSVKMRLFNSNGKFRVECRDSGIGIQPEVMPRLFQRFEQADNSSTRKFGGTGLGLAISKSLVEMMGGKIGCENISGGGAIFWFELPLKILPSSSSSSSSSSKKLLGLRVLVAENDPVNQLVIEHILLKSGCTVKLAVNGKQAVEACAEEQFDIILMDCQMPEMDGFEAARRIRSSESGNRDVPILALTASVSENDRHACLAAGMNEYLTKPIEPEKLKEILALWLRQNEEQESSVNNEQIFLVQGSFEKVRPISEVAAGLFYGRLFELDPSLRPLFKNEMKAQGAKLMQMLGVAVGGLDKLDTIVPAVQELGRRHKDYGVLDEHYATVGEALLWTLEKGLGADFTEEVKAAWTETYALLADVMKKAAK